jgi:hypothetical protein
MHTWGGDIVVVNQWGNYGLSFENLSIGNYIRAKITYPKGNIE